MYMYIIETYIHIERDRGRERERERVSRTDLMLVRMHGCVMKGASKNACTGTVAWLGGKWGRMPSLMGMLSSPLRAWQSEAQQRRL